MPNRLATSTSPYLRQHADNPVDWHEWNEAALERARSEDKPILLSVGYSACHWCHVMAHESFEDADTAAVMNEHFVSIKVDREERPDIDAIYQRVVQLMDQGGGWPLTVFLTPEGRPFYGGTYFPGEPRYGRPSFRQILGSLADAWAQRRDDIEQQAEAFVEGFRELSSQVKGGGAQAPDAVAPWSSATQREAAKRLLGRVDGQWGGFGREPKFPNATALEIVLRTAFEPGDAGEPAREAVQLTLDRMYRGGIWDHLRGGFARYSTDRIWLVPHFEKMLYDNAQLLGLYAEASVLPGAEGCFEVAREIVQYLCADMRAPEGTFYAATDADSEGEEGKYFVWTPQEITRVLGDEARARTFCTVYGVRDQGNFEHGLSILHLPRPLAEQAEALDRPRAELEAELAADRAELLAHRSTRVPPQRDDKILTGWNALLVSGLARAAAVAETRRPELARAWTELAVTIARRLLTAHVTSEGQVWRASFEGKSHTRGVLDDVVFLGRACLDLHELTLDPDWRAQARALAEHALAHHLRPERDGFYLVADDAETLIERIESQHDGPIPSGLGVAIELLARLDKADDAPNIAHVVVEKTLDRYAEALREVFAYASLVTASARVDERACHVRLRSPSPQDGWVLDTAARLRGARLRVPHRVGLSYEAAPTIDAIVCQGQVCTAPLRDVDQVLARAGLG